MKIKMELLSDVIFGNGMSVPGAEDTSVLTDKDGFPYYKGGTFKGLLREEYENYLKWRGLEETEIKKTINRLFGKSGGDDEIGKLVFSNFELSPYVKSEILKEVGNNPQMVLDILSNLRSFTAILESGVAKEGSLRTARCVDKGLCFYSEVECGSGDADLLKEVIEGIRWIGTKRNRGFGKVKLVVEEV